MVNCLPPPILTNLENIPLGGNYLVTFNHYHRPGFNAWWFAMAIAAALPLEAHLVMTNELTFPGAWYGFAGRPLSRFVLKRIAKIYGFDLMPPMPPRPSDTAQRAGAVRSLLTWLKNADDNPVIMLAPEGGDQAEGLLARPPVGVGRMMQLISAGGLRILPAAFWEQDSSPRVSFGEVYALEIPMAHTRDEVDRLISQQVMERIARLLPESLRGDFR